MNKIVDIIIISGLLFSYYIGIIKMPFALIFIPIYLEILFWIGEKIIKNYEKEFIKNDFKECEKMLNKIKEASKSINSINNANNWKLDDGA